MTRRHDILLFGVSINAQCIPASSTSKGDIPSPCGKCRGYLFTASPDMFLRCVWFTEPFLLLAHDVRMRLIEGLGFNSLSNKAGTSGAMRGATIKDELVILVDRKRIRGVRILRKKNSKHPRPRYEFYSSGCSLHRRMEFPSSWRVVIVRTEEEVHVPLSLSLSPPIPVKLWVDGRANAVFIVSDFFSSLSSLSYIAYTGRFSGYPVLHTLSEMMRYFLGVKNGEKMNDRVNT